MLVRSCDNPSSPAFTEQVGRKVQQTRGFYFFFIQKKINKKKEIKSLSVQMAEHSFRSFVVGWRESEAGFRDRTIQPRTPGSPPLIQDFGNHQQHANLVPTLAPRLTNTAVTTSTAVKPVPDMPRRMHSRKRGTKKSRGQTTRGEEKDRG